MLSRKHVAKNFPDLIVYNPTNYRYYWCDMKKYTQVKLKDNLIHDNAEKSFHYKDRMSKVQSLNSKKCTGLYIFLKSYNFIPC